MLALEAVLPTGEIVRTGSKAVKNVVGYDLTQLLVGSEGTLAIVTRDHAAPGAEAVGARHADGRLRRHPPGALTAVTALITQARRARGVELIDADSLRAAQAYAGDAGTGPACAAEALLIVECDGTPAAVEEEIERVDAACRDAGATHVQRAATEAEREELWAVRRQVSLALRATGLLKINHDVVVPRGRVPELFDVIARAQANATRCASPRSAMPATATSTST